ncbi:hypothetical protein L9F63_023296 [Diploptera punctata]|uniref:Uncharacterized protein n=1 Tax=Diploptera punctata TaxID=6984 RepID=A0AAD7ZK23_DIPPU|nr:hypothetical protein L9F63_023296 [Diploptera punctata]
MGQKSKRTERLKAISAANQIRDQDPSGRAQVNIIGLEYSIDRLRSYFDENNGSGFTLRIMGNFSPIYENETFIHDQAVVTLYHVSDATGEMTLNKVGEKPLKTGHAQL